MWTISANHVDGYTELVGRQVKRRRTEMGISLRELARRTDLTAAFLSQVERGETNTSISSLRRIAEALDVSFLYFLQDHPTYNPVVRANKRPKLSFADSNADYELLTPSLSGKVEFFMGRLRPGPENVARPLREPTEEVIIVLSGELLVGLDSGEYILAPGDSIHFKGVELRKLANAGDVETTWISSITPPVF